MKSLNSLPFLILAMGIILSCGRQTSQTASSPDPAPTDEKVDEKMESRSVESVDLSEEGAVPIRSIRNPDTVLTIEKTACYGDCPVYKATILSDGKIYYLGRMNVPQVGYYQSSVPLKTVRAIDRKMEKVNILSRADRYPEDGEDILDISNTLLSVEFKRQKKQIYINHAAPVELNTFVEYIEDLIEQQNWKPASID